MRSFTSIFRAGVAVLATFGLSSVANAADLGAATAPIHSLSIPLAGDFAAMAIDSSDQPAEVEGMGQAVASGDLEAFRGGESTPDQEVDNNGRVTGNTANRIVSGTNSISDGAFGNAAGINTVIQNSGSNVLIQNGMIVNVQFANPGQ